MNNNEKSNVVDIATWRRNKQLKDELRQIEANRPIETPESVKIEVASLKAIAERRKMHIVGEIIDQVPKAAEDDTASSGPEFYYDK